MQKLLEIWKKKVLYLGYYFLAMRLEILCSDNNSIKTWEVLIYEAHF